MPTRSGWLPLQYLPTEQPLLIDLMDELPHPVRRMTIEVQDLTNKGLPKHVADQLREPVPNARLLEAELTLWNLGDALVSMTYELPMVQEVNEDWLTSTRQAVWDLEASVQSAMPAWTGQPDLNFAALWVNPVFVLHVDDETGDGLREQLSNLVTVDQIDLPFTNSPGTEIRVARHCVVVTDNLDDEVVHLGLKVIGTHHACWGAALSFDVALGREVALIGDDLQVAPAILEAQASRVLSIYLQVKRFRLGYASVEAHLDPDAVRLWRALEDAWKFQQVLRNVDERLEFVKILHGQLHARLQDGRARVLNEIALAFTFFSLFSILLATLTFVELPRIYSNLAPALAGSAILLTNVVAYFVFRRRFYVRS